LPAAFIGHVRLEQRCSRRFGPSFPEGACEHSVVFATPDAWARAVAVVHRPVIQRALNGLHISFGFEISSNFLSTGTGTPFCGFRPDRATGCLTENPKPARFNPIVLLQYHGDFLSSAISTIRTTSFEKVRVSLRSSRPRRARYAAVNVHPLLTFGPALDGRISGYLQSIIPTGLSSELRRSSA